MVEDASNSKNRKKSKLQFKIHSEGSPGGQKEISGQQNTFS